MEVGAELPGRVYGASSNNMVTGTLHSCHDQSETIPKHTTVKFKHKLNSFNGIVVR